MRISKNYKDLIPDKYKKIAKLKSILIRNGNRERTNTFLIRLLYLLKLCATIKNRHHPLISFISAYPLNNLKQKDPIKILDRCLYRLMPAFILRRRIRSGKPYDLPVSISPNRAFFMSAYWLFQAAHDNHRCALTIPYLITQEIGRVLHRRGAALKELRTYIKIALNYLPFKHYTRKKRKIHARSKKGRSGRLIKKRFRKTRSLFYKKRGIQRGLYKVLCRKVVRIKRDTRTKKSYTKKYYGIKYYSKPRNKILKAKKLKRHKVKKLKRHKA